MIRTNNQLQDTGRTELERIIGLWHCIVLLQSSDVVYVKCNDLTSTLLHARLTSLLRVCLRSLELGLVDAKAKLLRHETCKVDGEAVGII